MRPRIRPRPQLMSAQGGEERVPLEMTERLVVGDNPVRVWREIAGLTLDALRSRTGLSKGYLSDIENAK